MSIRWSFAALTGLLITLLLVLGVWQYRDGLAKVQAVQWLEKTSLLLSSIQSASAELAVERGLTASLLGQIHRATKANTQDLWLSVQAQQDISNHRLATVQFYLDQLLELAPHHPIGQYHERLEQLLEFMAVRRQALAQVVLTGKPMLDEQHWIADSTQAIEVLYGMAGIGMLPLEGNIYSYASRSVVQDVLFSLSEYLGRERALLSAVLSRNSRMTDNEIRKLDEHHSLAMQSYKRLDVFLAQLPEAVQLHTMRQTLAQSIQSFSATRDEIVRQSQQHDPYRLNAQSWFEQATLTITNVRVLADYLDQRFYRQIAELGSNAAQSRYLVIFVFLAVLLCAAASFYFTRQRILQPLYRLTTATQAIAAGNLHHAVHDDFANEIGTLAASFEYMRLRILDEQELQRQNQQEFKKLYTAIEQSVAAMLITDDQGVVEFVNAQFCTVTGYRQDELIGQQAEFWRSSGAERHNDQAMWYSLKEGKVWVGEVLNKRKDGELYWSLVSISPVLNEQGKITHYIDIHLDISEHKRLAQKLDFISYYDQITGLPNRQFLVREFNKQKNKESDKNLILLALSIGRLKHINDSLSWQIGDKVLMEVGWRLKSLCTENTIVAHQEGGKFSLLYLDSVADEALSSAQKIIEILQNPVLIDHHKLQLLPKIGIASCSYQCGHFDYLFKHANIALHYAEQTTESYSVYDDNMDRNAQRRLHLENSLRQAISAGELELHYQPKVDTKTGSILAVEALARWRQRETGRYIPPAEFIALAEETGLIFALGDWVLNEACRQIKEFSEMGIPSFSVAVNISTEQLKQPDFAQKVERILTRYQIHAANLEFELTESLFIENPEQALLILSELKNMGLKLAIDDFGTGYSSLAYLSRLPVDYLKIDRGFVDRVTNDLRSAAIATSIIALGHRMGLKVIAEGIETEAQYHYLAQQHCDQMQGFYFSKPLTKQALIDVLLQQRTNGLLKNA